MAGPNGKNSEQVMLELRFGVVARRARWHCGRFARWEGRKKARAITWSPVSDIPCRPQ